jgi:hypothetical protein
MNIRVKLIPAIFLLEERIKVQACHPIVVAASDYNWAHTEMARFIRLTLNEESVLLITDKHSFHKYLVFLVLLKCKLLLKLKYFM